LRAALLRDGAGLLEELLNQTLGRGSQGPTRAGQKRYGARAKVIETLLGPITLRRDYLWAAGTGEGHAPLDEKLGLIEGYSPGLAQIMCRIGAQQSYQMAAEDLRVYAGVGPDARAIARMVNLLGPGMEQSRQARGLPQDPPPVPVMYVQADGTGVPVKKSEIAGRKGKQTDEAKTREIKLGCVFTQHVLDIEGNPLRDEASTTYLASFLPAEDFGLLLRREAFARGMAGAGQLVFIGDGAAWVWELARVNFPGATHILDFYHAAEHLGTLADALYGEGTAMAASRSRRWRALLRADRIDSVIAQARSQLPAEPGSRRLVEKELAYLQKNRDRMLYATFRSRGYFIGSGVVEAGCKTVVGKRLKNSGMFWSLHGAQNVLTLRTALLGNHFDADWQARPRIAA
jgi:hypothetical protein